MLDKKQIQTIFLLKFKMCHKAVDTTCNINNTLGPGAANEHTVQWWLKKLCKGDKSLEDEGNSGWPSEVSNDHLRAIIKADSLTTIWEVARELNTDHSMLVQHLNQIGKVKKLNKWVPHELTTNQRNHGSEVSSSLILCNNEPFLNHIVMCDEKWILYDNQSQSTQWLDWEETPKYFPKPNLHPPPKKKVMVTPGGLLPVWSTTIFRILVKPLHLRRMLSKLMKCTENCNTCSWHLSIERTQFSSTTTPDCTLCNQHFKSWTNWGWSFASSTILTWTFSNWLPLLQASQQRFAGKTLPHQQDAENAFQEFTESQSTDFSLYGNKQIISHGDKCTDCNSSYFDE